MRSLKDTLLSICGGSVGSVSSPSYAIPPAAIWSVWSAEISPGRQLAVA